MEVKQNVIVVVGPNHNSVGGIATVIKRLHLENKLRSFKYVSYDIGVDFISKIKSLCNYYWSLYVNTDEGICFHLHTPFGRRDTIRNMPLYIYFWLLKKRYIIHIHSPKESSLNSEIPLWITRYILKKAFRVIVIAPYWQRLIKEHIGITGSVVFNPVVARDSFSSSRKENRILFVGSLDERKGHVDLIHAFKLLLERTDATLVLAGNGDVEGTKALVRDKKLKDKVEVLGWLSSDVVAKEFQRAKVFCLPSYGEGLPMSVLEAIQHNVPTVLTPVGGIPDILIDQESTLFVKPGDIKSMCEALYKLLSENDLSAKIIAQYDHVKSLLSQESAITKLEEIYREL